MSKCKQALMDWATANNQDPKAASIVKLIALMPPIKKLDSSILSSLKNCERLSLSTNAVEKMCPLNNLPKLKILSLGRNRISKIEHLHSVASSLEQLWIS